jgi:uncharacterized protein YuzE
MAGRKMSFSYDRKADVLYLSVGKPKKSISREIEDGILLRLDQKTKEITGLTIIDFEARFQKAKPRTIDVNLEAHLQPA